jgi:hypothetical protein
MRDEGLHLLRNVFADRVATNPSINSFLAMDLSYFDSIPLHSRHLFDTGEAKAPFFEIFRRNGYKIQSVFATSYFGMKEKSDLDFYGVANESDICEHIENDYAFLGYCLPLSKEIRRRTYTHSERKWEGYLAGRFRETMGSSEPWLTLTYLLTPGHTKLSFRIYNSEDLLEYSDEFRNTKDPHAASVIRNLIKFVRKNDPDSILLILGDHGAWISRGLKRVSPEKRPIPPKDYFQERHAIAAGVYPKEFCFDEFERVSTLSRVGRTLVKCLSAGIDPLPPEYQSNDEFYLDYLYE